MADVVVNNETTNPMELLGQGVRAYILHDYNAAVAALGKASELLVSEHGDDLHDSLADVYLYYGKALLDLSREDSEALGNAVKNKPDSEDEEEEAENAETEEGDEKQEGDDVKTNGTAEVENVDGKSEEKADKVEGTNGTVKDAEPSGSSSADNPEENDEEPSDLQVAWEVLELAKKIYQKRGEDGRKHLAETLVVLGEVSLESENFESAVNDIKEGLRMQKELFPEDSRTVAETHYKLGMAHSTNTQIDEAVENFKSSLQYLQNRIAALEKAGEKEEGAEDEILEIKGLMPDVEEKIADMKSYRDEVCQCDVRTTIREFVGKPKFDRADVGSVNKIEVRRKPTLEAALDQVHI